MKRTLTFLALAGTLCVLVVLGAVITSKLMSRLSQTRAGINRSVADGKPWGPSESPVAAKRHIVAAYGKLPLTFEENHGQSDGQARFLARGIGYTLFLTPTETAISMQRPSLGKAGRQDPDLQSNEAFHASVHIKLLDANPATAIEGLEELPGKNNYLIGNDPARWRTRVPQYARVRYRNVYRGVDLIYYGNQEQVEHDFVVARGADPSQIHFRVTGADWLELDGQGELVMHLTQGELRLKKPKVYQDEANGLKEVAGSYSLRAGNQVGFALGAYDKTKPLVIDPILMYSTYLGGSARDSAFNAITLDAAGNIYIAGATNSLDFPTTANSLQPNHANNTQQNAFVTKLSADGSQLIYSTYLGGANGDARGVAVDSQGNAYIAGRANTADFPTTQGAFQRTFGGGNADVWVAKLSPDGSSLLYCTYLGGTAVENGNYITVDDQGQAIVPGATSSVDFPVANAFQSRSGGGFDGFVTKLSGDGSRLVYSTYLGGGNEDRANWISRDALGNVYVSGRTASPDFPVLSAFQRTNSGGAYDAWLAKVAPDGSLILSTFLGGSGDEGGGATAVDSRGVIHFTGATNSADFPTVRPIQPRPGGGTCGNPARPCYDAFVAGLSSDGSRLLYSTYFGGSGDENCVDACGAMGLDGRGNVYIAGYTSSTDFPNVNALQPGLYPGSCGTPPVACSDGFITSLSADGQDLVYSTYLGGSSDDVIWDMRVGFSGDVYVIGLTGSLDYPTVSPLQQTYRGGANDSFVSKIGFDSASNTQVSASGIFHFAQAGGGGGFSTSITLTNPSTTQAVSGSVSFFAPDGRPLDAVITNAVAPFVIQPSRTLMISSLRYGTIRSGYARVVSTDPILANATYLIPGLPFLSVGPSSTGTVFRAPISRAAAGVDHGIAFVNLLDASTTVTLTLTDSAGNERLRTTVNLARGEQVSRFLSELMPAVPNGFVGTLGIAASQPTPFPPPAILAALVVEFGPRQLHAVPLTVIR
jgi:Beta-propeller repeat